MSLTGDVPKAKILPIGTSGTPAGKDSFKEGAKKEGTPTAAAKVTAAKAVDKDASKASSSSGKTSPTPSSGRSSPSAEAGAKATPRDADAVQKDQTADVDDETLRDMYGKEHVNIFFIGHVDAGKSTLGGAILYITVMVDQRTLDKVGTVLPGVSLH